MRRLAAYLAFLVAAALVVAFDAVLAKKAVEAATLAATLKSWLNTLGEAFQE